MKWIKYRAYHTEKLLWEMPTQNYAVLLYHREADAWSVFSQHKTEDEAIEHLHQRERVGGNYLRRVVNCQTQEIISESDYRSDAIRGRNNR